MQSVSRYKLLSNLQESFSDALFTIRKNKKKTIGHLEQTEHFHYRRSDDDFLAKYAFPLYPLFNYHVDSYTWRGATGVKTGERPVFSRREKTERDLNLFYLTPKDHSFSWRGGSFSWRAGRGTLSSSLFPSSGRAPLRTRLANYVKHDEQPATNIDFHRRMFYDAYYFREGQSSGSAESLVFLSRAKNSLLSRTISPIARVI